MDLQNHLKNIEKRRDSHVDLASQGNFSDFKQEHGQVPKPPDNSMKYDYSITNQPSSDSLRPKFGQGPFKKNNGSKISGISHLKKQNNIVAYSLKKEKVNSEKIFKKNHIKHYNMDQNKMKNRNASSHFKQKNPEFLDLKNGQLISANPANDISNLVDDSMGITKNGIGVSGFLKFPEGNIEGKSKISNRTDGVNFF